MKLSKYLGGGKLGLRRYYFRFQQIRNQWYQWWQARKQRGEAPLETFSPPLEKCVGHSLKLLDIVQKLWAPRRKLFAPPNVSSWLRA